MTAALLVRALGPPSPLMMDGVALFLDLDGTLAPIAPRPDGVRPDERRTALLGRLAMALDGRLAIVSGRSLEDIDRIVGGVRLAASAVHGLVTRVGDVTETAPVDPAQLAEIRTEFQAFARRRPEVLLEDKAISLALHYRLAPDLEHEATALVKRLAQELGWMFQPGRAVAELRPPGPTKGDSVRDLMRRTPFAGATPVFVGDDLTDEDGFTAAVGLGGFGVVVGARRRTAASYRLGGVPAVLDWLEASLP